jgi:hypothetical protein
MEPFGGGSAKEDMFPTNNRLGVDNSLFNIQLGVGISRRWGAGL